MPRAKREFCIEEGCDERVREGSPRCDVHHRAKTSAYQRAATRRKAKAAGRAFKARHGVQKKTICTFPGCSAPKWKHYFRCEFHMRAYWAEKNEERHGRKSVPRIKILLMDYRNDEYVELIARPLERHPMPDRESTRKQDVARARADGAIIAIIE